MKKVIYAILIAALATAMLGGCQDVPERKQGWKPRSA